MRMPNLKMIKKPGQVITVLMGLLFLLAFTPALYAATYYADATLGKDTNDGLSQASPWKTIAKVNASSFAPGDSILFKKGGTWRETLTVLSSGTSGHPISFGAYGNGAAPTIDATGLNWGISSSNKNYITITGLEVKNATQYGIRNNNGNGWLITLNNFHNIGSPGAAWPAEGIAIEGGSGNTVSYNIVYEIGRHGISLNPSSATCSNNIVERNTVYNSYHSGIDMSNISGTSSSNIIRYNKVYADANYADFTYSMNGIYCDGSPGHVTDATQIYYNLTYNLPGKGIQVGGYSTNIAIFNNTVANKNTSYSSWLDGIAIGSTGVSGIILKNNISYGYDGALRMDTTSTISELDHNDWYTVGIGPRVTIGLTKYRVADQAAYIAVTGFDRHGLWNDPLFASASDFYLQSTSPCINAGTDVGLSVDLAGRQVPYGAAPDIGAFEWPPLRLSAPYNLRLAPD
jgi:hypothetical protein